MLKRRWSRYPPPPKKKKKTIQFPILHPHTTPSQFYNRISSACSKSSLSASSLSDSEVRGVTRPPTFTVFSSMASISGIGLCRTKFHESLQATSRVAKRKEGVLTLTPSCCADHLFYCLPQPYNRPALSAETPPQRAPQISHQRSASFFRCPAQSYSLPKNRTH
jgi:hypothetical protein